MIAKTVRIEPATLFQCCSSTGQRRMYPDKIDYGGPGIRCHVDEPQ